MENSVTILYVEDDPNNRILVRRILQAEGYRVLEAADAQQAMQILESQVPDLIFMDINMPDIDGYTLTTRLKSLPRMSAVPIVAMTANVMRGDRERSLEAGCDGYIQKPIDVDKLPEQIGRFLATKKR
ncbi:MAG: response regulator [Anaerolineales bacterium]|nr:response regulator [Anaerolineales bacterium]